MKISRNPIITIVKKAPINNSSPAVWNMPTRVLADVKFKDLLMRNADKTRNTNSTTNARSKLARKGQTVSRVTMLCQSIREIAVASVRLARLMPMSDRKSNKDTKTIATVITPPAMAVRIP